MPEDFYAALMMRRALPTTTNIKNITDSGIYPVESGNSTAPDSLAGALIVLPPKTSPKVKFIAANSWNVYSLVGSNWQGFGSAAIKDVTTSNIDTTSNHILKVGDYGLGIANGSVPLLNSIYDIKCSGEYNALGDGTSTPTTGIPAGVGNTRFAVSAGNIFSNQYLVTLTSNVHFYVGVVDTAKKTSTWSKFYNTSNKPSANDVGAIPTAIVGSISNNGSMANAKINGWWQVSVSDPKTVPGFPKHPDGTYLYGYGYMFNWVIGNTWFQIYYAHHGENATRQNWSAGPDTATAWVIGYNTVSKPTAGDVGAYSKAEGDARYQAKGSYTPAGQAYTKSESDARFLNWNYNAIGSVCFARFDPQNQTIAPNGTTAGSNLHAAGITGYPDAVGGDWMALRVSGTLSGTWRCLGSIQNDTDQRGYRHYSVSLFVRIA